MEWGFQEDNIGTVVRFSNYFSSSKKGLIIPCGYGQVVGFCNSYFPGEFFGCDTSDFLIKKGKRRGSFVGDIRSLEDYYFIPCDLLVCCDLLEHFEKKDIERSLCQIDKVTEEESFFILRVLTDYDKGFFNDETHITCKDDRWWKDKVESNTGFRLHSMSGMIGEMVFYKGEVEDALGKKRTIDNGFFEYNDRLDIIKRKNKEFFVYKRHDNRLAVEIVNREPFFRKYIISFEISGESSFHLFYDDFGRIKILDELGISILLSYERVF